MGTRNIKNTKDFVLLTALLTLTLIVIALTLKVYQMPSLASFNMQRIVKEFSQDLSQKKLSEREKERLTKAFSVDLVKITQAYAQKHHVIILVSPAIVAGTPDITQEIQASIYQDLNARNKVT